MAKNPSNTELSFIVEAAHFLEHPNLLMRLAKLVGQPVDILQCSLPEQARLQLGKIIDHSLKAAMQVAVHTLANSSAAKPAWEAGLRQSSRDLWLHTAATAGSGAIGGWLGLASLPLELPVSTTIIFRSISSAALQWGYDARDPTTQMECLFIFTLGSDKASKDLQTHEMEESYLTTRIAFAQLIQDAARYISLHSNKQLIAAIKKDSAPILVRLLSNIASSFQISVSRKIMTTAVPLIGAVTGAVINAAFCDYFTAAARYHFGLKFLERCYGKDLILDRYQEAGASSLVSAS